ncbi:acyl-CoA dehydrogenase family protein [Gordonia sp. (in: high G+C Gram-positive bacteria)]|uniref:acyl-CoA dehydrogenase family protein n=1 Tax=Gordonia sp. (in: high G+C Gram-positive bacteria) TaxID=84139 RepID=UPI0016B0FF79|nr:acyl-CoA dehydrogenase family protein [Gordonia sp. (in: high G+C Gram-positive bacteria)]NLG47881.1 DNA alkylation response protein [Gordonia sp. (in: high G+C Gram-positive bacteria)]
MSATHQVFNQAPPRIDVNEYTSHTALVEAVGAFGGGWATDALTEAGALVGRADFQRDAELANTILPKHLSHDRWGNRIDDVEFHPAYHRIIGDAIAHGAHTSCWSDPRDGAHVARAAMFMQFGQIEPGHACPVSMTHAVVPSLRLDQKLADEWLPRVFSTDYQHELGGIDPSTGRTTTKTSAIFGMAMTEKQGGSDVRANTTRAVEQSDGTYLITGHKWFCSAPQSDAFLVLANTAAGVTCFVVPRVLPDGTRNVFNVQRLKDKLGNKSNASSEVEFDGTVGWRLGDEGAGVRSIIEMVNQTRLDCILGSAAGMRQSVAEAAWHVRNRAAFGATLVDQPAMTAVIADLQVEAEAAVWTGLRLAAAYDDDADESAAFRRLATAVGKYWVCKRGPNHAYEALECLGGNGYTENGFPLSRRYREQPVMAVWEGSGNVIALDVLRAMMRDPLSVEAVDNEFERSLGVYREYDLHVERTRKLIAQAAADPLAAPALARRLTESMAIALQGAILIRQAPEAVTDAFMAGRIADPGHMYGVLDAKLDLSGIVARA